MKWAQSSKILITINCQWYWPLAEHRVQVLKRLTIFHMEMSKCNPGTMKGTRMPMPGSLVAPHHWQSLPVLFSCHNLSWRMQHLIQDLTCCTCLHECHLAGGAPLAEWQSTSHTWYSAHFLVYITLAPITASHTMYSLSSCVCVSSSEL